MIRHLVPVAAVLLVGGCVSEAQINAQLARHIGQSEADLVREMGVPTRHYSVGQNHFLAYAKGYQQIIGTGPAFGPGFGYGGYGYPGWGYWGWGGWGWGGYGFGDADVVTYGCETTFEVTGGRVVSFTRHGNDC